MTCDESWLSTYDPETKQQSMHWKSPNHQGKKRSEEQIEIQSHDDSDFFDMHVIVYINWVLGGQTIKQYYYLKILMT